MVSDGECPGRWWTASARPAKGSSAPSVSGVVTFALRAPGAEGRVTARSAKTTSSGMPWRSMIASAKASSSSMHLAE